MSDDRAQWEGSHLLLRFYAGTCDMRRQIAALVTMVREELGRDPQCGDLYLFRGRRGDQIKILFYDQRGYCMLVKRLDEGTFPIVHAADGNAVEITLRDLASLMASAEMASSVRAKA